MSNSHLGGAGGEIIAQVTNADGLPALQLRSQEITHGISGAPVLDIATDRVVGMVTEIYFPDASGKFRDAAYAIPAETIQGLCTEKLVLGPARVDNPFMVGDRPAGFVPRPQEFEPLKAALLEAADGQSKITVALCGAGGYGKTTLARELCHDPQIRNAFPDGVLWVELGQTPDILKGAREIIVALTGKQTGFVDEKDAAEQLAQTIGKRRCLLVVDDVWSEENLEPFLSGGPHCARLVTTRRRDVLPADAELTEVDAMRINEAVALLGVRLPLEESSEDRLRELATRLGKWPLLISLVNAVLRPRIDYGQPMAEALAWASRELDQRGLSAFDAQDSRAREHAVSVTVKLSLDDLHADQRARYAELAVFPEGVEVPLATVTTLWGATGNLNDSDVERLCVLLAERSLVQYLNLGARTLRLHDVMHNYLMGERDAGLSVLNLQLVKAYAEHCSSDSGEVQWDALADDGYIHDHLVYHLECAGRHTDIHGLFAGDSWIRRRSRKGLISDFVQAKRLAVSSGDLAIRLRYAIFESIVQAMYARAPVQVLTAMVGLDLTEPGKGLTTEMTGSLVQIMRGENVDRVRAYLNALLEADVRPVVTREILDLAAKVKDPKERVDTVLQLIDLVMPSDLLPSARRTIWRAALEIDSSRDRQNALESLHPLSQEELEQLRTDILGMQVKDSWLRGLPSRVSFDFYRAVNIWSFVASCYDLSVRYETWQVMWERAKSAARFEEAVGYLFPRLPENLKDNHVEEVWEILCDLPEWESVRYFEGVVRPLLPYVLPAHLYEAWERAKIEIKKDEWEYCGRSLALILPHLPRRFVLDHLPDIEEWTRTLSPKSTNFEQTLFYLWVNLARHLSDGRERLNAYSEGWESASYHSRQEQWLRTAVEQIEPRYIWGLWKQTAPRLENADYRDGSRSRLLAQMRALACRLPQEHLQDAVEDCLTTLANSLRYPHFVAPILGALSHELPSEDVERFWRDLVSRVLEGGFRGFQECSRIQVAICLLEQTPAQVKELVSNTILNAIESITDPDEKLRARAAVLHALPTPMQPDIWLEAWAWALRHGDVGLIVDRLIYLLVNAYYQMTEEQRDLLEKSDWNAEVWSTDRWNSELEKMSFNEDFAQGLALILRYSPREFRSRAWQALKNKGSDRGFELVPLFPVIPTELHDDVLDKIIDSMCLRRCATLIDILIESWPKALVWNTWRTLLVDLDVDNDYMYEPWLVALTHHLGEEYASEAWHLVLDKIQQGWHGGEAWRQIPLALVDKLAERDLAKAYQGLEDLEDREPYRLYNGHIVKVALAERLPSRDLVKLVEAAVDPFPMDIFTCSLNQYIRYLGHVYDWLGHPPTIEDEWHLSKTLRLATRLLVPLCCLATWMGRPFAYVGSYWKDLSQRLYDDPMDGYSDAQKRSRMLLVVILLMPMGLWEWTRTRLLRNLEETLIYSRLAQTVGLFSTSRHLGRMYAITKKEAEARLEQMIPEYYGLDRLCRLIALRPTVERAGGKELCAQVQSAFTIACDSWQEAIKVPYD